MAARKTKKKPPAPIDSDGRRSQWLKGLLEICILGVLSSGEAYGYELLQRLDAAGLGTIKGGTLYPRLAALEAAGLVDVEWRAGDGGPGRKYYHLTPLGQSTRIEAAEEFHQFSNVVQGLIAGDIPRKASA